MAYNFKRLSDVEALAEVPESATVLAEVDGSIKRIPSAGLGGGGIKTAIIKDSEYDNTLAGLQTAMTAAPEYTYECINMTFEEAYETMASGEPLAAYGMLTSNGSAMNMHGTVFFEGSAKFGVPCIVLDLEVLLFWTADGLSTSQPSSGK